MARIPKWLKLSSGFLLAAVAFPLVYAGIGRVIEYDPFRQKMGNWANPFGRNIGSIMESVDINVYQGDARSISFHANRLDIRRDKQFIQVQLVSNGTVYEGGKPSAHFDAGLAEYDVARGNVGVGGGARLFSPKYDFQAHTLLISQRTKTIGIPEGVTGTYDKGNLSAKTLTLSYGGGPTIAEEVVWKGPVSFDQEGKQETRTLQIRSARSVFLSKPDREIHTNAEISDKDSIMRTRLATWDKEKDILTLEGECEYYGPDSIITAPKVVIYRKEKRIVATGDVKMLVKPEKEKGITATVPPAKPELPPGLQQPPNKQDDEIRSGKNTRKYPVVVTCTQVEYFYTKGSRHAIMTGSPKARQEMSEGAWREIQAPKAIYDEEKEILNLLGEVGARDVKMSNSLGDKLAAESLEISTKEGEERMTGTHVEGVMKVKEEEIGKEKGGGGGKKNR